MKPSFNFDGYEIISCNYSRKNEDVDHGEIGFESNIAKNEEDKNKFRYTLNISITGSANIELVIAGYFTATDLLKEDELMEGLKFTGMYILLPFARSFICTITGQDGRSPIIIPLINVGELIAESEEEIAGTEDK